jgi:hypothetical protein
LYQYSKGEGKTICKGYGLSSLKEAKRMIRPLIIVVIFASGLVLASCDRVEKATDTLNKVKTLKSDMKQKASSGEDSIKVRAEEVTEGIRKDMGIKSQSERDKEGEEAKQQPGR